MIIDRQALFKKYKISFRFDCVMLLPLAEIQAFFRESMDKL